jgi:glycosyltransferase involved in cell wall biosynthesis
MEHRSMSASSDPRGTVRITVLMSVYDAPAGMLDRAVDSILTQTRKDFEFLILDDGSRSEGTRAALERIRARDTRIRLLWEPHRGVTATLNRGLALAHGELIARQDADDWSEPERLKRQTAFLDARPEVALLGSAAWIHRHDGTPLWPVHMPETHAQILAAFPRGNPYIHGSVMFRCEAARQAGGYREQIRHSQDYDLFWRLAERGAAANLHEPLYHYRYTAGAVSAARALDQARDYRTVQHLAEARRIGRREDFVEARRAAMTGRDLVLGAALKQADHLMLAGDYGAARKAYWQLARAHPASFRAWGKLARLALFCALPPAREMSFR